LPVQRGQSSFIRMPPRRRRRRKQQRPPGGTRYEMKQLSPEKIQELSPEQLAGELDTDLDKGLGGSEIHERLEEFGLNVIEEKERNAVLRFLSHFWGPIAWMIEAAALLSVITGHWEDFGVIFAMLLINGLVGFWQEHKAQNAIEALKEQLAPEAIVIRDGHKKIEAQELVPGDLLVLRMGDVIPADVKLAGDGHLSVDESSLTGESLPVDKKAGDPAYSGTSVKRGEARAVVSATGGKTKFARTVELVASVEEKSHFQKAVMRIGYHLMVLAGVLVGVVVILGLLRGDPVWHVILFALVLIIAGIPSALPAVMTSTMAIGARRLAKMKAIVSRLAAMEEMAGLSVLCSDKTGTLTKNELALQKPVVFEAKDEDDLIVAAALTARREGEDPIDRAVLGGLTEESVLDQFEIKDFRPFDPTRKRAEADVSGEGGKFTVAKGAPQVILELVGTDRKTRHKVADKVEELGQNGFRSLGVARRKSGGHWQFLGLLPLLDPPREDSAKVVRDSLAHGLRLRMVTGDHGAIARQVARQVGLGQNIRPAGELVPEGEGKNKAQPFDQQILEADGFSEVTPEDKFQLIKAFQANNHIVGMTGDGVNDAPALKQADVGIAVSGATDAARAASDLVLTLPGLGVIVNAVEEARRIFERMIAYATYRITETIRLLFFMMVAIVFYNFYPVTPVMVALLAILNDIPIITIATDNVPTAPNPVRWDMRRVLSVASALGLMGVVETFLLFWYLENYRHIPYDQLQSIIFLKLLVAGHLTIYVTRNTGWLWQRPWPSWKLFVALECTQIFGTLACFFGLLVKPIGWKYILIVWGYALVWVFIENAIKVLMYRWVNPMSRRQPDARDRAHGQHVRQKPVGKESDHVRHDQKEPEKEGRDKPGKTGKKHEADCAKKEPARKEAAKEAQVPKEHAPEAEGGNVHGWQEHRSKARDEGQEEKVKAESAPEPRGHGEHFTEEHFTEEHVTEEHGKTGSSKEEHLGAWQRRLRQGRTLQKGNLQGGERRKGHGKEKA
jgi:H+-transporting ATPase